MGRLASVYAGPFAMWPESHAPLDEHGGEMFADEFGWFYAAVVGPGSEPGAGPSRAVFYTPNQDKPRPGGPVWVFSYTNEPPGEYVGADFRRVDREAEVEAFRRAYARELAEMAKAAGREPVLGWGVLYGYA
jgi:hypothetical protein